MIVRCVFFLSVMLLSAYSTRAQSGYGPSAILEEYIREGIAANLALKQEQLEVDKAVESLREAKSLFYPHLTFSPTYSVAFGGRRLAFPVGDMLNPAYAALNELTGSDRFPTDIQNVNELLAPHNFHDTRISFQYALYNPQVRYHYLIQNSLLSAQEARLKVVSSELKYAISEAYYQYLQALNVQEVYNTARTALVELVRLNTKLADNHVITRDGVLSAEYEVSELDRQRVEAEKNVKVAGAYFNFLLNRDTGVEIVVDTLLSRLSLAESGHSGLEELVNRSLSVRPELGQLDYSLVAAEQALKLQEKSAALPSLFVGGNAGFQGFGYRFTNQGYMLAQVGLQWDLFKGFERKAKIGQARLQAEILKAKRTEAGRRIELEVTRAYHNLEASRQGLKVADAGVEKARALYRIVDSRYRNQNVLLVEFLKARSDLQNAHIRQALARYELLVHLAHLERVAGG